MMEKKHKTYNYGNYSVEVIIPGHKYPTWRMTTSSHIVMFLYILI